MQAHFRSFETPGTPKPEAGHQTEKPCSKAGIKNFKTEGAYAHAVPMRTRRDCMTWRINLYSQSCMSRRAMTMSYDLSFSHLPTDVKKNDGLHQVIQ